MVTSPCLRWGNRRPISTAGIPGRPQRLPCLCNIICAAIPALDTELWNLRHRVLPCVFRASCPKQKAHPCFHQAVQPSGRLHRHRWHLRMHNRRTGDATRNVTSCSHHRADRPGLGSAQAAVQSALRSASSLPTATLQRVSTPSGLVYVPRHLTPDAGFACVIMLGFLVAESKRYAHNMAIMNPSHSAMTAASGHCIPRF